jgi:glycosyltransferase involved in cell wall biosynthesis
LHLLALLEAVVPGRRAMVAMPADLFHSLPDHVTVEVQRTPDTQAARLGWEQRRVPAMARRLNADLVHWLDGGPALFGPPGNLISPAGYRTWFDTASSARRAHGFVGRWREALAHGGLARARAIFWPEDLPPPQTGLTLYKLPPVFAPQAFYEKLVGNSGIPGQPEDLPETYILYHGPLGERDLFLLLDAWSWAVGSLGEYYPLLVAGVGAAEQPGVQKVLEEQGFGGTVRLLPPLPAPSLAAVYRGCSALLHPGGASPWGGSLRLALACARPVVALESAWSDAIVGPAAYLVPPDEDGRIDARGLGGALLTVVVEENVAEQLAKAAREQVSAWETGAFYRALEQAYLALLVA